MVERAKHARQLQAEAEEALNRLESIMAQQERAVLYPEESKHTHSESIDGYLETDDG